MELYFLLLCELNGDTTPGKPRTGKSRKVAQKTIQREASAKPLTVVSVSSSREAVLPTESGGVGYPHGAEIYENHTPY